MANEHAESDIRHNTQQMKHLQYENQTRMGECRAETMTQLKMAQEHHAQQELSLLSDKRELRRQLREAEQLTELQQQQLRVQHSEHLHAERTRYQREADEMKRLHEQRLAAHVEEAEHRHRMELAEVEERKSEQIARLLAQHEKAFAEIRNYYNELTLNNLALIGTLREQLEELRERAEKSEKTAATVQTENRRLLEPSQRATADMADMQKRLENSQRDRAALRRTTARAQASDKQLSDLVWETETLRMRCEALTEERDALKARFERSVMEVQQKAAMKCVLLERKLAIAADETERREVLVGELQHRVGEGTAQERGPQRWEVVLKRKNEALADLRYELARVCKAHNDLIVTYESKLAQFGVPLEEMGFQPIRTTGGVRLGGGPAGLVAKTSK